MESHRPPAAAAAAVLLITLLGAFLLLAPTSKAHNITQILSQHTQFSTFNHFLSLTHLAGEINRRETITVCAVGNAAMNELLAKNLSIYSVRNVLSLHVLLDYFGAKKLHQINSGSVLAATMYQDSGSAPGTAGYVSITDLKGGKVGIGVQDIGKANSMFVKSVKEIPYNISVIQVSKVLSSPDAEAPASGPVEIDLHAVMSSHGCKAFADTLAGTEAEKIYKSNAEGGLTVFCPRDEAFKSFFPKYKNLKAEGQNSLLLYHAVPLYESLRMLRSSNGIMNTLATDGRAKYDFTVQNDGDDVTLRTRVDTSTIIGTIIDEQPLAIYYLDNVLRPRELFKPELAPAAAPKSSKKKGNHNLPLAPEAADSPDGVVADELADDTNAAGGVRTVSVAMAALGFAIWVLVA